MLRTEPSFEIYSSDEGLPPGETDHEDLIEKEVAGIREFSFRTIDEDDGGEGENEREEDADDEDKSKDLRFDGPGDGDEDEIGNYYKRILKDDPSNPLFLRKVAQLLQSKGDTAGAEEHYFLATLYDPKDGETLMEYAKLVWELYGDKDRAFCYFKRAVLAAPQDSHVIGAYARFLWEIGDEDDELKEEASGEEDEYHSGATLRADASDGEIISEYAKFIWKHHQDREKASFYFERAIQASLEDSNVKAAYASFLWETEEG